MFTSFNRILNLTMRITTYFSYRNRSTIMPPNKLIAVSTLISKSLSVRKLCGPWPCGRSVCQINHSQQEHRHTCKKPNNRLMNPPTTKLAGNGFGECKACCQQQKGQQTHLPKFANDVSASLKTSFLSHRFQHRTTAFG